MGQEQQTAVQDHFFSELIALQEQLFYFALQLTENRDEARDLVQEASYKALKNRSKLHNSAHVRAWLYTILKNTHINYLRSSHYKQMVYDSDEVYNTASRSSSGVQEGPEEFYVSRELRNYIKKLPEGFERPINLYLSGFSYKEISNRMDIPIGTVKSRIHLGKKQLKKVYMA